MKHKCGLITIFFIVIAGTASFGAEKKGFLISTSEDAPVPMYEAVKTSPRIAAHMPATDPSEGAFIEVYAHEKEIERLKKLVEKRNREIGVLQEKLNNALDKSKELEVQLYTASNDDGVHYEVKKGDCLWRIAKRRETYNDPLSWIKIYNANMDRIKDPNLIYPGQLLRIPK